MKVARALTSKAIFYYSSGGNTRSIVDETDTVGYDIVCLNEVKPKWLEFEPYDTIILGCPSYGKGVPPDYFKEIAPQLMKLKHKRIGLFGSGQTIYGDRYCGALDVLYDFLREQNDIIFLYRFESYPTEIAIQEFQELLNKERVLYGNN
jgi:flavodoxin